MSLTLGEKLRQAREERGFTLAEVSEQTRISPLYLESIENDDYRILPGGIFNKGFVKSYAKFVGLNEQEALMDYAHLLNQDAAAPAADDFKVYRPEVLTDDRSAPSMIPTMIFAVVILALMTAGILFGISYLRESADEPATNTTVAQSNANATSESPASNSGPTTTADRGVPDMATLKVELRAVTQPVPVVATVDGTRSNNMIPTGSAVTFEPRESLTLNYNRWNSQAVQLSINGKPITLPAEPLRDAPDRGRIEFTISKDTLAQIWASGAISTDVPGVPPSNANTVAGSTVGATPLSRPPSQVPRSTPPPQSAAVKTPTPAPVETPPVNRP
jgi:cytoskeleton protein RodZ